MGAVIIIIVATALANCVDKSKNSPNVCGDGGASIDSNSGVCEHEMELLFVFRWVFV